MRQVRFLLALAFGLFPACGAKNGLLRLLRYDVDRTAVVSPVLLLRVETMRLGRHAWIGTGTAFRNLRRVELGAGAKVGTWNTITANLEYDGPAESTDPVARGTLMLREGSFITNRHYLDCSGGLVLDDWAAIAGVHTIALSHSLEFRKFTSVCGPIHVGSRSFVSAGSRLLAGSTLPERSILAAGAVLRPGLTEPDTMYAGVPARAVQVGIGHWKWFHRSGPAEIEGARQ